MALAVRLAFAFLPLCAGAAAQSATILHAEGDVVPGVGTLRVVGKVAVNDRGDWLVEADMELPGSTGFGDFALLGPAGVVVAPNQPLSGLPGITADLYRGIGLTREGEAVSVATLIGSPVDQRIGLLVGDRVERRAGFPVDAAGWGAGDTWSTTLQGPLVAATGRVLVTGEVLPGGAPPDRAGIVEYRVDGGAVVAGEAILTEGDFIGAAGGMVVTSVRALDVGSGGRRLTAARELASGRGVLLIDGDALALEGAPSAVAGRTWADPFVHARGSLGSRRSVAFVAKLEGSANPDDVLVRNGVLLLEQGDTHPAIAPFTIERFTTSSFQLRDRPQILESGAVLFGARWNDPAPGRGAGIFLDDRLVVEAGVTAVGSKTVGAIDHDGFRISPNGRWLIVRCSLLEPGQLVERAIVLFDLALGSDVCDSVPNSTGARATLAALGPAAVPGAPLELVAHDLPADTTGYFLVAPLPALVAAPGGSQGVLCLGGSIGRYIGQAMDTGPAGYMRAVVDTQVLPLSPNRPVLAGERWYFQGWYRDQVAGPTSNFTTAVSVQF